MKPVTIPGLPAASRSGAFRSLDEAESPAAAAVEADLRASLGALPSGDAYWQFTTSPCPGIGGNEDSVAALVDIMTRTHVFMTNGQYDALVYTKSLPATFASWGLRVAVDATSPAGAARPGAFTLDLGAGPIEIRFPSYEAGHEVTLTAAKEFGEDLAAWLLATGAAQ